MSIYVLRALEDLIVAVHSDSDIPAAMKSAKEALGWDPTIPQIDYVVTLALDITAASPEEAVKEFQKLVRDSQEWMYGVETPEGDLISVDSWSIKDQ